MTDQTVSTDFSGGENPAADWRWLAALGVLMMLGGVVALLNPFTAALTATAIAGATFLIAGGMQIWMAFTDAHGTAGKLSAALLGALLIVFSLALLVNPLAGIVSLTLLVGAFFVAMGVMRVWMGIQMSSQKGQGWVVAAGAVTFALGILTLISAPVALGLLGIFLGADLLFSGSGAVALALGMRRN